MYGSLYVHTMTSTPLISTIQKEVPLTLRYPFVKVVVEVPTLSPIFILISSFVKPHFPELTKPTTF
jgi:hypothetical protein